MSYASLSGAHPSTERPTPSIRATADVALVNAIEARERIGLLLNRIRVAPPQAVEAGKTTGIEAMPPLETVVGRTATAITDILDLLNEVEAHI